MSGRTAMTVGKIPHVDLSTGILEQEQGAGHHEFNVIRMRGGGKYHDFRSVFRRHKLSCVI
jgi:hypothetical protein